MSFYVWETRHEKGENDVGKVRITQEQEQIINDFKRALAGFGDCVLIEVVKGNYDIELEYKIEDWVYHKGSFTTSKIIDVGGSSVQTDNGYNYSIYNIRHATPEEIKAEKERRLWKKISREVGQFKFGDRAVYKNGETLVLTNGESLSRMKKAYREGDFKGFYPVESFISFEDGEES